MPSFVSKKYDITFLHIPKTAGISIHTWAKETLGEENVTSFQGHPMMSDLELYAATTYNFSVIRNPWDRMLSLYSWLGQIGNQFPKLKIIADTINNIIFPQGLPDTFNGFILALDRAKDNENYNKSLLCIAELPESKFYWGDNFLKINNSGTPTTPCVEWAETKNNMIIMKYETLDQDFMVMQEIIKTKLSLPSEYKSQLPFLNSSQHDNYRQIYSTQAMNVVAKWYAKDIDYGKYVF